jgi:hypothetical protein
VQVKITARARVAKIVSITALGLGAVVALLSACEPSDEDYVNVVREQVRNNCCQIGKDGCTSCPYLEGAHVTWSKVGNRAAANGNPVTVGVEGPHGSSVCTFTVGRMGRTLMAGSGGCEPK